jgi:hypothetical protein
MHRMLETGEPEYGSGCAVVEDHRQPRRRPRDLDVQGSAVRQRNGSHACIVSAAVSRSNASARSSPEPW